MFIKILEEEIIVKFFPLFKRIDERLYPIEDTISSQPSLFVSHHDLWIKRDKIQVNFNVEKNLGAIDSTMLLIFIIERKDYRLKPIHSNFRSILF